MFRELLFIFLTLIFSIQVWAVDCNKALDDDQPPPNVIGRFFSNYGLLASGFGSFIKGQSEVLAPAIQTEVEIFGKMTNYSGREGYFQSIKDWGGIFSTGADFGLAIQKVPVDGEYEVDLSGTLTANIGGKKLVISSVHHHWKEFFTLDADHQIVKLRVLMNIDQSLNPH
jgi:hypothetical protein